MTKTPTNAPACNFVINDHGFVPDLCGLEQGHKGKHVPKCDVTESGQSVSPEGKRKSVCKHCGMPIEPCGCGSITIAHWHHVGDLHTCFDKDGNMVNDGAMAEPVIVQARAALAKAEGKE